MNRHNVAARVALACPRAWPRPPPPRPVPQVVRVHGMQRRSFAQIRCEGTWISASASGATPRFCGHAVCHLAMHSRSLTGGRTMPHYLSDEELRRRRRPRRVVPVADPDPGRLERRVHARCRRRPSSGASSTSIAELADTPRPRARHEPPPLPGDELRHGGRVPRHEPGVRRALRRRARRGRRPGAADARAPRAAGQLRSSTCRLHFVRDDFTWPGILDARRVRQAPGTRCSPAKASPCSATSSRTS